VPKYRILLIEGEWNVDFFNEVVYALIIRN